MSVLTALGILILILVIIDLGLTAGIIRRLRTNGGPTSPVNAAPPAGLHVDFGKDAQPWPAEAHAMLSGVSLVAIVIPGCPTCQELHRDVSAAGGVAVPFYVIGDPDVPGVEDYLSTWTLAQDRYVAPMPTDALESFAHPKSVPAVMLLRDGVIQASGHRLSDVAGAMRGLASRSAVRRSAVLK